MNIQKGLGEFVEPSTCTACDLHDKCRSPNIKPLGPLDADIILVGEAPGKTEDAIGEPFCGPAGEELDRALAFAGISRSDVLITNVCRCFPNGTPKQRHINKCVKTHLDPLLRSLTPRLIVTLGGVALKAVTGLEGITQRQNVAVKSHRYNCTVLPVIHPASILHSGGKTRAKFREGISLIRNLLASDTPQYDYGNYTVVNSVAELTPICRKILKAGVMGFDIEATGLKFRDADVRLTALGFAYRERESFIISPSSPEWTDMLGMVAELLSNSSIRKIGQNMKFDSQFLKYKFGIEVANWYMDTMLAHFLLDERPRTHSLSQMCWEYLPGLAGYDSYMKMLGGAHRCTSESELLTYCMADVDATMRLASIFRQLLKEENQWWFFSTVLMPAAKILSDMEYRGVMFDREYMEELDRLFTKRKLLLESKMKGVSGVVYVEKETGAKFNPRSRIHLEKLLLEYYRLPKLGETKKGNVSLDKTVIERYANEYDNVYCRYLTKYRALDKLHSTYIIGLLKKMDEDGIIYPEFHLEVTETGRTSSDNPNMQNIPRDPAIKNIVRARPGYILAAMDFPQAEIRVAAMVSGDENLIKVCNDSTKDFHTSMASEGFGVPYDKVTKELRTASKGVSFGILYQMGPYSLSKTIGRSVDEARGLISDYFSAYPDLRSFIDSTIELIRTQHYVTTPFGRRRRFKKYKLLSEEAKARCERQGVNSIIQATSSDFMLITMIRIDGRLKDIDAHLLVEVHDSIVVECNVDIIDEVVTIIKEEVSNCTKGFDWAERVLMWGDVEVGFRLGEMVPYEDWKK